ncbi:glycosyltransferase [Neobacillus sp. C211]|uniref:glycosyltransferase n=1 Tax=unclassified Neobacillus TaxID=2675272 RepID=UPI003979BFC3
MKNILVISPENPYPAYGGGQLRILNILKKLPKEKVILVILGNEPNKEATQYLKSIVKELYYFPITNEGFSLKLKKVKSIFTFRSVAAERLFNINIAKEMLNISLKHKIESILCCHVYTMLYSKFIKTRLESPIKIYLDAHNVEYKLSQSFMKSESNKIKKAVRGIFYFSSRNYEKKISKSADQIWCTSLIDYSEIESYKKNETDLLLLPNGVDCSQYEIRIDEKPKKHTILFTGTMDYYPNTYGVKWFYEEVFKKLKEKEIDYQFIIAGKNPTSDIIKIGKNDKSVIVTGKVESMKPYWEMATFVVCPLFHGSGTSLKVLESWASGKVVVATSKALRGLEYISGKHVIESNTPEEFLESIDWLLKNDASRRAMEKDAMLHVQTKYDWNVILDKLPGEWRERKRQ